MVAHCHTQGVCAVALGHSVHGGVQTCLLIKLHLPQALIPAILGYWCLKALKCTVGDVYTKCLIKGFLSSHCLETQPSCFLTLLSTIVVIGVW